MKQILIALILTSFGNVANAQLSSPLPWRKNVLSISPLAALGHVSVFYERAVAERVSLVGGVGFGSETYQRANNSIQLPSGRFQYKRITLEGRYSVTSRGRTGVLPG